MASLASLPTHYQILNYFYLLGRISGIYSPSGNTSWLDFLDEDTELASILALEADHAEAQAAVVWLEDLDGLHLSALCCGLCGLLDLKIVGQVCDSGRCVGGQGRTGGRIAGVGCEQALAAFSFIIKLIVGLNWVLGIIVFDNGRVEDKFSGVGEVEILARDALLLGGLFELLDRVLNCEELTEERAFQEGDEVLHVLILAGLPTLLELVLNVLQQVQGMP